VSVVCYAWLIKDWEDCTSLVIEVMPLLAAWIVLMPLDIESSSSRLSGSGTTFMRRMILAPLAPPVAAVAGCRNAFVALSSVSIDAPASDCVL
jgi:hypothetical protein